jgi:hypothetical protein
MLWAQTAVTLLSLGVCSFAPGFLAVRRLPWRPVEKICGALAASLIAVYLLAFSVYCFAPGSETGVFRAAACAMAGIVIWQWRDIRNLARSFGARQALLGFGFLLVWSFLALGIIRNYSGAGWTTDWIEHFQRSLFFLYHLPALTAIAGGSYILPARPPMMNLLAAFFMAQTGDRFEIYQIVLTFLNLLAFFPCCLLLHAMTKGGRAPYLALVALFALNPMLMQNAWYSWTKLFAAFFVLTALAFYLAGLRKRDMPRMLTAFLCLAAGLLVHYSAGPYLVFLAGHYLLTAFSGRSKRLAELTAIAFCCGLLLATWFGWSIRQYGVHATVASNTSVTSSQQYQGSAIGKIEGNLWDTIVPPILRDPGALARFDQPNGWGELRDCFFSLYQTNLVFALGLIGGPFVLWLLFRGFRGAQSKVSGRYFWLAFLPTIIVLGIAVVGERDTIGLAHLTLLPIVALGITLLAASFPSSRTAAMFLLAGCIADFALGIFLQVRVENFENSPERTLFSGLTVQRGQIFIGADGPDSLSRAAWVNWSWKNKERLLRRWIQQTGELPQTQSVRRFANDLTNQVAENSREFGGWYGRHDGHLALLGDDLSPLGARGIDVASVLFLFLFLALMRAFWKQGTRPPPMQIARPAPPRRKTIRA